MISTGALNPLRSALMMLGACSLIAATTIIAKSLGTDLLGEPLHPLQVSAGRFLFALMGLFCASLILRPKIQTPAFKLHIGRTFFGWAGVSLMFTAVVRIPVSDATAISFLNPIFGMLLAIPLLGERVGLFRWSAVAIAFVGAVILLRPGSSTFDPAAFIALLAAFCMGIEVILIKKLTGRESPLQILIINNCIGAIIACSAASFFWSAPTMAQWGALAAIGLVMLSAQSLFIQSMRSGDASFALPFSYSTLIFATFYDFWIFDAIPGWVSILGAAVILSGALLLGWREIVLSRRQSNAAKPPETID
ncbi:DMT family transporter [Sneathiella sp.]|uniref:DMT family transporter n=1 Tax=Sneathiella sp. TaxID=1964365 RepID=UPI002619AE59|nr:DMT family transporter [Sneathiella sp.]MDF2368210.1 DMT family transporter [Sneathiella sp.]